MIQAASAHATRSHAISDSESRQAGRPGDTFNWIAWEKIRKILRYLTTQEKIHSEQARPHRMEAIKKCIYHYRCCYRFFTFWFFPILSFRSVEWLEKKGRRKIHLTIKWLSEWVATMECEKKKRCAEEEKKRIPPSFFLPKLHWVIMIFYLFSFVKLMYLLFSRMRVCVRLLGTSSSIYSILFTA